MTVSTGMMVIVRDASKVVVSLMRSLNEFHSAAYSAADYRALIDKWGSLYAQIDVLEKKFDAAQTPNLKSYLNAILKILKSLLADAGTSPPVDMPGIEKLTYHIGKIEYICDMFIIAVQSGTPQW